MDWTGVPWSLAVMVGLTFAFMVITLIAAWCARHDDDEWVKRKDFDKLEKEVRQIHGAFGGDPYDRACRYHSPSGAITDWKFRYGKEVLNQVQLEHFPTPYQKEVMDTRRREEDRDARLKVAFRSPGARNRIPRERPVDSAPGYQARPTPKRRKAK